MALPACRAGPPVFGVLKEGVSEDDVRKIAEVVRPAINQALGKRP